MKPYYEDTKAGITIYHGDCLQIMPELETKPTLIFTSPPYNKGLRYNGYNDKRDDFKPWIAKVLQGLFDCSDEPIRAYFVVSEDMLYWMRTTAEQVGWTYGQLMTWCKTNLVGGSGKRITGDWNTLSEWILLFRKGKRGAMLPDHEGNTFNWFLEACPQSSFNGDRHRRHVAQMPLALAFRILRRTPGNIILDPFCGSGTTLLAAKRMNRQAIGIDVDESACEIAASRLAQEVLAL
jgi:DNA modification methylase